MSNIIDGRSNTKSEMLQFSQRLRKKATDMQLKGDHFQANKCLEDAELIESVFTEE